MKALATNAASCALEAAQGPGRWAQSPGLFAIIATRPWAIVSDWKRYQISRRLLVVLVKQLAVRNGTFQLLEWGPRFREACLVVKELPGRLLA